MRSALGHVSPHDFEVLEKLDYQAVVAQRELVLYEAASVDLLDQVELRFRQNDASSFGLPVHDENVIVQDELGQRLPDYAQLFLLVVAFQVLLRIRA